MNNTEILYEVNYTLTNELANEGLKGWFMKKHKIFSYGTLLIGVMSIIPGIWDTAMKSYVTGAYFLGAGAILLLLHFFGYKLNAMAEISALHKIFGTDDNCGEFRLKFYENMFEQSTKIATKKVMYSELLDYKETNNLLMMSASGRKLYFVSKVHVADEKGEEFIEFIKRKISDKNNETKEPEKKLSEVIASTNEKVNED